MITAQQLVKLRKMLADTGIERTPKEVARASREIKCQVCGHTWLGIFEDGSTIDAGILYQCINCNRNEGKVVGT